MLILIIFSFICALQTIRIYLGYDYLRRNKIQSKYTLKKDVFLIIPVLEEQNIIRDSVKSFSKLINKHIHLIYVTSAKERKRKDRRTTLAILRELRKTYPIKIINCPIIENALMAHQINYAIKKIIGKEQSNVIFGIYNVDSKITKEAIYEAAKILDNPALPQKVVQQYTLYPSTTGGILSHIALWQNRWTLHFELGRILIGLNKYFKNICNTFNYVIGHGLFFTRKTWYEIGGIPENVANEDASLSLTLYAKNYTIYPIHHIEYALIAKNIKVFVKQQSVWFNGPFCSFIYALKLFHKKDYYDKLFYYRCISGSIKLFTHAIYWLFGPLLIWIIIPFYYYEHIFFLIIWYCLALYHCYVLNIITMYYVNKIKPKTISQVGNPFYAILAYLLHSVGPAYCILKTLFWKNSIKNKYKTEK